MSFKVTEFGANQEPVYDFLLVINSNLGPILHHYRDTATYWPKISNFAHPFSFSTLVRGDPLRIYGKHGSYYSAEYIFPDFPEQNELFSLTNLFMRNTNAGFQLLAITLETRAAEQMKK